MVSLIAECAGISGPSQDNAADSTQRTGVAANQTVDMACGARDSVVTTLGEKYGENRVEPGFIRTEADEVHYNLHILLRLELERALIAGNLDVADLEAAWRVRFAEDFGREPPDAARGVLQDVHWSVGIFGYFPTYALGNIYSAALFAAMRRDLPDLDGRLSDGDLTTALVWLRENIHRHGRLKGPAELVASVTGAPPSIAPLLAYLEEKYATLYDL